MKELTVQEAALAWAQGKKVEACPPVNNIWLEVTPVGAAVERPRGKCLPDVFTSDLAFRFRLAPELPAKKYRPWTPDEVPLGSVIGAKWDETRIQKLFLVSYADHGGVPVVAGKEVVWIGLKLLLERYEYSIDPIGTPNSNRKWLPCGVEVEA